MKKSKLLILSMIMLGCVGCTSTQTGAMWGGGAGAVAGQLIGGDTKSTLIGGGIGALGGALINDYANQPKPQPQQMQRIIPPPQPVQTQMIEVMPAPIMVQPPVQRYEVIMQPR